MFLFDNILIVLVFIFYKFDDILFVLVEILFVLLFTYNYIIYKLFILSPNTPGFYPKLSRLFFIVIISSFTYFYNDYIYYINISYVFDISYDIYYDVYYMGGIYIIYYSLFIIYIINN